MDNHDLIVQRNAKGTKPIVFRLMAPTNASRKRSTSSPVTTPSRARCRATARTACWRDSSSDKRRERGRPPWLRAQAELGQVAQTGCGCVQADLTSNGQSNARLLSVAGCRPSGLDAADLRQSCKTNGCKNRWGVEHGSPLGIDHDRTVVCRGDAHRCTGWHECRRPAAERRRRTWDSLTSGWGSGVSNGANVPGDNFASSWATGSDPVVDSHLLRLQQAGATISASSVTNLAVPGVKVTQPGGIVWTRPATCRRAQD